MKIDEIINSQHKNIVIEAHCLLIIIETQTYTNET